MQLDEPQPRGHSGGHSYYVIFMFVAFLAETVSGDQHSVPCPDGSDGLTQAVYESGNVTAWMSVTCVPGGEFREYAGDVTLQGEDFGALAGIQDRAFHYMTGTLSITGAFDALEYIGWSVFSAAGTAGSKVNFTSLQSLQSVGTDVFGSYAQEFFKGVVALPAGPFPNYSVPCGTKLSYPDSNGDGIVLHASGDTRLSVELYESGDTAAWGSVTCIPQYEFYEYEGNITLRGEDFGSLITVMQGSFSRMLGTLSITGAFEALEVIENNVFSHRSSHGANSNVNFTSLPSLVHVHGGAFGPEHRPFMGTVTFPPGPFPNYDVCGTRLRVNQRVLLAPNETAFTIELFEDNATTSYEAVTCVPEFAFINYPHNVTVLGEDFPLLAHVGIQAFEFVDGRFIFDGPFCSLLSVGKDAFDYAGYEWCSSSMSGGGGGCDSIINMTCTSPDAMLDMHDDFGYFDDAGEHDRTGETVSCPASTCAVAVATTTTTTPADDGDGDGDGDDGEGNLSYGVDVAGDDDGSNQEECIALLQEQTGSGAVGNCLNGGICKLRRGNCSDSDVPYNVAVCDCGGRPFAGTCFYGVHCGSRVDSCPLGTKSCNVIRKVKAGRDPAPIVCSSDVWPKALCTADEESATIALLLKANIDPELNRPNSNNDDDPLANTKTGTLSSPKVAGIVVGVLVVASLICAAALYRRKSGAALVDSADEIDTEANVAKKQGGGGGDGGGGGGGGVKTTPTPIISSLRPDVMLTSDGGLRVVSVRRTNPLTPLGVTNAAFIIPEAAQPEYSDAGGAAVFPAASDDASTSCRTLANQIYDQNNEDPQRVAAAAAGSGDVDYDVAAGGGGGGDVDYDVAAGGGGGGGGSSRKATNNMGMDGNGYQVDGYYGDASSASAGAGGANEVQYDVAGASSGASAGAEAVGPTYAVADAQLATVDNDVAGADAGGAIV